MRDDIITVSGPFEIPPLYVPEYVDEDGTVVLAHVLDMSRMRRMKLASRACACGQIHGYTAVLHWDMLCEYREFAEFALESMSVALLRSIRECPHVPAVETEGQR